MSSIDKLRRKVLNTMYRIDWIIQNTCCDGCRDKILDSVRIEREVVKELFDRSSLAPMDNEDDDGYRDFT